MSDDTATHGLCPRCNSFQPVVWKPVEIAEIHADGRMGTFKGLEMKCRQCDFMITKVGRVGIRKIA